MRPVVELTVCGDTRTSSHWTRVTTPASPVPGQGPDSQPSRSARDEYNVNKIVVLMSVGAATPEPGEARATWLAR